MGCPQDVVVRSFFAKPNKTCWINPRAWLHIIAVASAVVLGLGLIDGASAAEISCTQESYLLTTQSDVDQLSSCVNTTGSIVFENPTSTRIAFNGLQRINGSLTIHASPALIEISAPNLYWINHNFTLADLPLLSNLSLPSLDTVVDGLNWTSLPSLVQPTLRSQKADQFGNAGTEVYGDITVSNTGIESLDFFQFVTLSKAENIRISDNARMNLVNFSQLEKSSSLSFCNNGASIQVVLPALTEVSGDLEMSRVTGVDVGKLARMDGGINMNGNSFENFSAPALTKLGGDVQIMNNPLLEDLHMPLLQGIGGGLENGVFAVSNNSALGSLDLPKLSGVDGNVTLNGGFSSISLPLLTDFSAGFHITTTHSSFNCSPFDTAFYASNSAKYPSLYSCYAIAPGTTDDTAIHNVPSKSDDSLLPKGAMAILSIVAAVAALLFIGLAIRFFRRRRAAGRPPPVPPVALRDLEVGQQEDGDGVDGLPQYSRVGKPGEVPPAYKQRRSGSNPEEMIQGGVPQAQVPEGQPPTAPGMQRVEGVMGRFRRWLVGGKVGTQNRGTVPAG